MMIVDMSRSALALTLLVLTGTLHPARAEDSSRVPVPPPAVEAAPPAPDASKAPPPESAPSEVREEILKDLYKHLAAAKDPDTAAAIAAQIERVWFVSGSDTVDLLMQRALKAMSEQRHDLALKLLTTVTELQPDYAEAWNRRAFVYFRMNENERALGDLRRALALEPNHYKALEGAANILKDSGSKKQALEALRSLLAIHPFLPGVKEAMEELSRDVEGQGI